MLHVVSKAFKRLYINVEQVQITCTVEKQALNFSTNINPVLSYTFRLNHHINSYCDVNMVEKTSCSPLVLLACSPRANVAIA